MGEAREIESRSVSEPDARPLAGKTALVSGAVKRIGRASALALAAGGRIINIGSLGGTHPWATHAHYCTSKAALHMLSQTMAKAWAPEISVNCVAPGMIVQGEVGEAYAEFAERTPMRRNGTAEDVAAAVLFFATGPHFITGQLLAVDGGLGL
jgi:3-oxoacyl-[acyl-carrier protein] reductase/pteridine reductase